MLSRIERPVNDEPTFIEESRSLLCHETGEQVPLQGGFVRRTRIKHSALCIETKAGNTLRVSLSFFVQSVEYLTLVNIPDDNITAFTTKRHKMLRRLLSLFSL